jgi:Family of unknown function (DUF6502)
LTGFGLKRPYNVKKNLRKPHKIDPPEVFMTTTTQDSQAVATCLAWALRPLVRLMVQLQFPLQSFVDILKAVYVEVAEREASDSGRAVSDSKISMMTGVHRADVAQLRREGAPSTFPPPSSLWRICNAWSGLEQFTDGGFARALRVDGVSKDGAEIPSFESLVEVVLGRDSKKETQDFLNVLIERKVAIKDANGCIMLERRWPDKLPSLADRMSGLAFRLHDAIAPRVENLIAGDSVHPTWTVYSEIKTLFATQGRPMLGAWNDTVTRAEAQLTAGQPLVRTTCQLLVYSEPLSNR